MTVHVEFLQGVCNALVVNTHVFAFSTVGVGAGGLAGLALGTTIGTAYGGPPGGVTGAFVGGVAGGVAGGLIVGAVGQEFGERAAKETCGEDGEDEAFMSLKDYCRLHKDNPKSVAYCLEKNVRPSDPIVIDLDGDGIELLSRAQGVYFDVDADGFAERIGLGLA